jgi:Sigma-70 region 2
MPLASFFSGRARRGGGMNIALIQTRAAGTSPSLPRARATCSAEMLIRRIAVGNQLAMRSLFAPTPLYRWLLRVTRNETLAEDLLSEVFLDVWQKAGTFEARSSVSTWLMAIARYKALSARRRPMRRWTRKPRPASPIPPTIRRPCC